MTLEEYNELCSAAVFSSLDENFRTDLPLLPPEYVFPDIWSWSMFWRMGDGESYADLYYDYFMSLSPEEQAERYVRYPIPYYMDDEKQFYVEGLEASGQEFIDDENLPDLSNLKEFGPEFVKFRFYSPVIGRAFEIRSHYYAFAALPDSEKAREIRNIKMGIASSRGYVLFRDRKGIERSVSFCELFPQNKPLADEYQSYIRRIADSMELIDIRSIARD